METFDGSGDYLEVPDGDFDFGSGDFTVSGLFVWPDKKRSEKWLRS